MNEIAPKHSWKYRRTFMFAVSGFAAALAIAALVVPTDPDVRKVALTGALTLLGAIVGSYVFGAVWDDKGRS